MKPLALIRSVALSAAFGLVLTVAGCAKPTTNQAIKSDDMTMGKPNAPVTVVEYASVTCSHCAAFNAEILPELKTKYIDTGKVRYVYREYLTPPQNVSAAGVLLARCAGRDKYFEVIDAIMRAQPDMFADGTGDKAMPVLLGIAKSAGLSEKQFNACVTNPEGLKRLQTNIDAYDKAYKIEGTPTFFINGQQLQRHTGDLRDFDKALKPLLKDK